MDAQKKSGSSNSGQLFGIIFALFLIAGIVSAFFFISGRLSLTPVPTAPESQPLAVEPGKGCCQNPSQCRSGKEFCNSSCVCKPIPTPAPSAPTTPAGGCFVKNGCAEGFCCDCSWGRDAATGSCKKQDGSVGGSAYSQCGSCSSPTVDVIHCGTVTCDQATQVCCPSGCKPKSTGCPSPPPECVDTTWTPDPNTVCTGKPLAQTSNCGKVRTSTGTNSALCGACTEMNAFISKANIWEPVTIAELSQKAVIGQQVKFSFTATGTTQVQVMVNDGSWTNTTLNTATGKYDFIYTIPAAGSFSVNARYLTQ